MPCLSLKQSSASLKVIVAELLGKVLGFSAQKWTTNFNIHCLHSFDALSEYFGHISNIRLRHFLALVCEHVLSLSYSSQWLQQYIDTKGAKELCNIGLFLSILDFFFTMRFFCSKVNTLQVLFWSDVLALGFFGLKSLILQTLTLILTGWIQKQ